MSVVVPVYNRAGLIGETLDSVASQTYRPIEVVIVDDGSTDNTVSVVRQWMDTVQDSPHLVVRLVAQQNSGAPAARNNGIEESCGEFLQFLDSDDILDPDKIRIQVEALIRNPEADFAYGRIFDLKNRRRMMYGHSELSPARMVLKQISHPNHPNAWGRCAGVR